MSNLDLNFCDSVAAYKVGSLTRRPLDPATPPPAMPLFTADLKKGVTLLLRGVAEDKTDALALESLVPRSLLMRQLHLLTDHRRAFVAGAAGTGKATLARHLASQLALRSGRGMAVLSAGSGAGAAVELQARLGPLLEGAGMPGVVVVEGLEKLSGPDLGSVLRLLPADPAAGPVIIGTLADTRACHLQLHHDFRMILLTAQSEPVRGLLGRVLRRRLLEAEAAHSSALPSRTSLLQVVDWLPKLWDHLNKVHQFPYPT